MSVSSVAAPLRVAADDCVMLRNVRWETYERLLVDDEERRSPRMTYDRGVLELVIPSMPHDEDAATITRIVDFVSANLGIPIRNFASTTFKRQDLERGFEADASFYFQNAERIRGQRAVDLVVDPPPDVVLKMEMSRSALNELPLLASMGIPEAWCCDGHRVTIQVLEHGSFRESKTILALPVLTTEVLTRFLRQSRTMLSPDWSQAVAGWVQDQRASRSGTMD